VPGDPAGDTVAALRGHHSHDRFDFSVDVFPLGSSRRPAAFDREPLRTLTLGVGTKVREIDGTLQVAGTGELIRTVLHAEHLAVYCNGIVPGEYIVGASFPGADVDEADLAFSRLATQLRRQQSRGSQNPGGYENVPQRHVAASHQSPRFNQFLHVDERTKHACRTAVRPDDLHVVLYCVNGRLAVMVDQLQHPHLNRFFARSRVERLREFYRSYAPGLAVLVSDLNRIIGETGGLLMKLVLDVEHGAIYYRRLATGTYVVGVTIDQARVRDADQRLEALASELGAEPLTIAEQSAESVVRRCLSKFDVAS